MIEVVPLPPSPHTSTLHNASGPFLPGDTVQVYIGGLESSTEYRVTAYSVNRAGDGPSIQAKFSTGKQLCLCMCMCTWMQEHEGLGGFKNFTLIVQYLKKRYTVKNELL